MKEAEKQKIYKDAVELWGETAQLEMAQEEATELALAVRKVIRQPNPERIEDLAGEIADVEIMIEQIKSIIPSIVIQVEEKKDFKLQRLKHRIETKKFEKE